MNGESEQIISILSSQLDTVMGPSSSPRVFLLQPAFFFLLPSHTMCPSPPPLLRGSHLSHSDSVGVPATCPGCSQSEIRAGEATGMWTLNNCCHHQKQLMPRQDMHVLGPCTASSKHKPLAICLMANPRLSELQQHPVLMSFSQFWSLSQIRHRLLDCWINLVQMLLLANARLQLRAEYLKEGFLKEQSDLGNSHQILLFLHPQSINILLNI